VPGPTGSQSSEIREVLSVAVGQPGDDTSRVMLPSQVTPRKKRIELISFLPIIGSNARPAPPGPIVPMTVPSFGAILQRYRHL